MATKARTKRTNKIIYEPVVKLPPLRYEDFVALRDGKRGQVQFLTT